MKKKFEDPKGYRYCRRCSELKPLTSEYWFANCGNSEGFLCYCKVCDKAERKRRFQSKESHNIKRICKECEKFFWAELGKINKGEAKFCSQSCARRRSLSQTGINNIGEKNPRARLKETQVVEIKKLLMADTSVNYIAEKFNVSIISIQAIKYGRTWKHVL